MQGINTVVLVGRLTADPVLRKTTTNKSVASFTVAIDRRTGQSDAQTADFINCVVWNVIADNVAKYIRKGSLVGIEGRLQSRRYQDKQGNNRTAIEVVCDNVRFLDTKGSSSSSYSSEPIDTPVDPVYPDEDIADIEGLDVSTDDLPF